MSIRLPDIYPDECVISAIARAKYRLVFFDATHIHRELFNEQIGFRHDLPAHLGYILRALPEGGRYSTDSIIDKHTLFPYYRPFISTERQESARAAMTKDSSRGPMLAIGLANGNVPIEQWLRFCPQCFIEDPDRFGERYWHRLHQVPGVELCPVHNVFLEQSAAPAHRPVYQQRLIAAEEVRWESMNRVRPVVETNSDDRVLLRLAKDVSWLLDQTSLVSDPQLIASRFSLLLTERGLASQGGRISMREVLAEISHCFSPELLTLLECRLKGKAYGDWPHFILRGAPFMRNPICYLLLMQFLNQTAEQFFNLPTTRNYFGAEVNSWPCLNPVCIHYQEKVIQTCIISASTVPGAQRQATVSCECGFTYTFLCSDAAQGSDFAVRTVVKYGHKWDEAFAAKWSDPTIKPAEMAQQLGFRSRVSLTRHAQRLGLPVPRFSSNTALASGPKPPRRWGPRSSADSSDAITTLRRHKRQGWLRVLRKNPGINRTKAQKLAYSEYWWLNKYDNEWLAANLPPKAKFTHRKHTVDALARDAELSALVPDAVAAIRALPGKPVRVTRTSIARYLRSYVFLNPASLSKLPLTQQALAPVLESHEKFTVRTEEWATAMNSDKGQQP